MKNPIEDDHSTQPADLTTRERRGAKLLLTGATGFLGSELLERLLTRRSESIICLVRGDTDAAAAGRGAKALARVLGRKPTGSEAARVEWVRADLEVPGLTLSSKVRARLVRETGEIFHCAASTRFDLPLADAERINVRGLSELLALAGEAAGDHSFRRLHHVSTAYAVGTVRGSTAASHVPVDGPRRFRNNYERSKASAERLLRGQERVPYTIYRPSIIVGDSRTGRTLNWNVIYPVLRMIDGGVLGLCPGHEGALFDVVPIDFVADGILALGARDDSTGESFHLTAGPETMTVGELFAASYRGIERHRSGGVRVRTRFIGPLKWWLMQRVALHGSSRLSRQSRRAFLARKRVVRALVPFVPYARVRCHFDARREHGLLAEAGVRMPQRKDFLPCVLDYAFAHAFGAPGRARSAPPRECATAPVLSVSCA